MVMNSSPFEMVSAPITLYTALSGTARPEISDDPPVATWNMLGQSGDESIDEDGVVITPGQSIDLQFVLGNTAAVKAFRGQEELELAATLLDLTAETFAKMMNGATVTTVAPSAGAGGYRSVPLKRGSRVDTFALLAVGMSPYADNLRAQWWVPRVFINEVADISFIKTESAGLEITFMALNDAANGFGLYVPQDLPPV